MIDLDANSKVLMRVNISGDFYFNGYNNHNIVHCLRTEVLSVFIETGSEECRVVISFHVPSFWFRVRKGWNG